ncbi:DegV family protein [Dehalococcoides mccartyi]|uniref:DegV family protein n=1 Tax=Dehalococcoides mccartyi TaxID=61435 RepID=A0A142V8T8_9CHLR|nr:DegV family protein [Dehalococcoides mccartyi]AMU86188.1 DegV family protein [Dehalococcoides mccartyi]QBX63538.1 DegV family protein [Dehalococcoides mccartyi]
MNIKIVTDSTADIPPQLAKSLGITIVPLYVRFGEKALKDGVEITQDQFFERLQTESVHPNTSQPSPQDFIDVYRELAPTCDGIVSIHISSKLSGTYDSAIQAKKLLGKDAPPIEVIDSRSVSMGLGLLGLLGAEVASSDKNLKEVADTVRSSVEKIQMMCFFDTLKYLALGGRIGKSKALLGSLLSVKPVLVVGNGELLPAGQVRSRSKGMEKLTEFTAGVKNIAGLSVIYTTTPDEAVALADRLAEFFPRKQIVISRLGAALGVHAGPGTLFVATRSN